MQFFLPDRAGFVEQSQGVWVCRKTYPPGLPRMELIVKHGMSQLQTTPFLGN